MKILNHYCAEYCWIHYDTLNNTIQEYPVYMLYIYVIWSQLSFWTPMPVCWSERPMMVEPSDGLYFSSKGKKVSYTSILPMGALLLYYVHMLYYSWPKKFTCKVFILFLLYIMYVMPVSVFEFLVVFILLQYFDNWPTPSK